MDSLSFLSSYTNPLYQTVRTTIGKYYTYTATYTKNSQANILAKITNITAHRGQSFQSTKQFFAKPYKEFTFWVNKSKSKIIPNELKNALNTHKTSIAGGAVLCTALVALHLYRKYYSSENRNRSPSNTTFNKPPPLQAANPAPPLLQATLETSLQYGALTITAANLPPQQQKRSVALTFCIDTSTSMSGNPILQVQNALKSVLMDAANDENSDIYFAITSFNHAASTIISPLKLDATRLQNALSQIDKLKASGSTSFTEGFRESWPHINRMLECIKTADHYFIFLTDGCSHSPSTAEFKPMVEAKINKLFVGVGNSINQKSLNNLATIFKGDFLHITETNQLNETIIKIYKKAVEKKVSYKLASTINKHIKLSSHDFCVERGNSGVIYIKITRKNMDSNFNFDQVELRVTYLDQGKEHQICLKWTPNSIIDPKLIQRAKKTISKDKRKNMG